MIPDVGKPDDAPGACGGKISGSSSALSAPSYGDAVVPRGAAVRGAAAGGAGTGRSAAVAGAAATFGGDAAAAVAGPGMASRNPHPPITRPPLHPKKRAVRTQTPDETSPDPSGSFGPELS